MKTALLILAVIVLALILMRLPRPCEEPLTYRIGTIDERFGLSPGEVSDAVGRAAALWEKALARRLFRESPQGAIEINLVYDYRQEATDRLKQLSYRIDSSRDSYEELRARFEELKSAYEQKNVVLDSDLASHNDRVTALNAEIETLRNRGGITEQVHQRLTAEKEPLSAERRMIEARQEELRQLAETINSLVVVINEIAVKLDLEFVNYRHTGEQLGDEFFEGRYAVERGRKMITIFQFSNSSRLIRVLSHELGHALGLQHTDKPDAIMYRINQSDSLELAPEDIALLKARCRGVAGLLF